MPEISSSLFLIANKNSKEDYQHVIDKAEAEIERLVEAIKNKEDEISGYEKHQGEVKGTIKDLDAQRAKEKAAFVKAQKADQDSIDLLEKAKSELGKFYRD